MRWRPEDIAAAGFDPNTGARVSGHIDDAVTPPAKKSKFGAIRTVAPASWGGTRVADSKAGAQMSQQLALQKRAGGIVDWFEEVSIPIGINEKGKVVRYRADAMVLLGFVHALDGKPALVIRLVDRKRKNMDTPTSKAKRAALRQRGLDVQIV